MRPRPLIEIFFVVALLIVFPRPTYPEIKPGITPVQYKISDNTKLTGFLSIPSEYQNGQRYPAILLIHGWHGINKNRPQGLAESYLKLKIHDDLRQKYVVFSAEYYADHLGDIREVQSIAEALKTMASLPQVDPDRIAAVGASHGGYLSLMSVMNPNINFKPKIAVSICGVVDVAEWVRYLQTVKDKPWLLPGLRQFACTKIPLSYGWPPDKDPLTQENFRRISVLTYIKNLQAAVLIIHGNKDDQVPISQAYKLRETMQQENKNAELLEFPSGHFIFLTKAVWEKIGDFLKKSL